MKYNSKYKKLKTLYILLFIPITIFANTMSSGSYQIEMDSLNSGGSSFSTSSNYSLGSTVGEVGTGSGTSSAYRISAGYWIPTDTYLSITPVNDVSLGSVSGLVGGQSTSSSSWIVKTNNPAGYQLSVVASTSPALRSISSSINDYTPVGSDPDFNFDFSNSESSFGFSPAGADVIDRFKNNGSVCNFGVNSTSEKCWDGFSTTTKLVSQSMVPNHPGGSTTTITYKVFIGSDFIQDSGADYSAAITVTAVAI